MSTQLFPYQRECLAEIEDFGGRALLALDMGLGKAQPLSAKILTPNGYVRMGDLAVGDLVFSPSGEPIPVISIHPQGKKKVYTVTFTDGAVAQCCGDHLWSVNTPLRRYRGQPGKVLALKDLGPLKDNQGNRRHFIPMTAPVQYPHRPVPLDPYLLGYLIANGCLRTTSEVTIPDEETASRLAPMLLAGTDLARSSPMSYRITGHGRGANPVTEAIRRLGLFGKYSYEKHLPPLYLFNSLPVRLALFQGLMDGDGWTCLEDGHLEYTTSSLSLAEDVRTLVQSFGGTAKLRHKSEPKYTYKGELRTGRPHYSLTLSVPDSIRPFRLSRKASQYLPRRKYQPYRAFSSIEEDGKKECQCITVGSQDGLYLTDHHIVTHNSLTSLAYLKAHPEIKQCVVVCPASIKWHWQREAAHHFSIPAEVLGTRKPPRAGGLPFRRRLLIINYDVLAWWVDYLRGYGPQLVILDEVHALAGRTTLRCRASRALCQGVPHVLALSGTPLVSRPAELWPTLNVVRPDRYRHFSHFAQQFCLPGDAPILMGDLTEKPIKSVRIGDTVIGWGVPAERRQRRLLQAKVLDVLVKRQEIQQVTLQDGTVLFCTKDHLWHTGVRTGLYNEYRIATTGRLGGGSSQGYSSRGCASRIMKVFRGTAPAYPESNKAYMIGYLHGFFRGDGHCTRVRELKEDPFKKKAYLKKWTYRIGCACKDVEPIDRVCEYLEKLEISHKRWIRGDGLFAVRASKRQKLFYRFLIRETWRNDEAWWAGFLGGIYDAEGSGSGISQYKTVNAVNRSIISQALTRFGFGYHTDDFAISMTGGRQEFLRFWNIANPSLRRKLTSHVLSQGGKFGGGVSAHSSAGYGASSSPFVVDIKPIPGEVDVYTLTTETGNYVAYGCGSKNCKPQRKPWGWSYAGATNLPLLHSNLKKEMMIRRRKEEVLKDLPPKRRTVVPLEMEDPGEYRHAVEDFLGWLKKTAPALARRAARAEQVTRLGYLKRLAAQQKLAAAFSWVDDFLQENEDKLLLFCVHKKIVSALMERYGRRAIKVDGSVLGKKRQLAFDAFNGDKKTRLLVGNVDAAGVGWSCRATSTVAFAELPWVSGKVTQAEDRCHGVGRGTGACMQSVFLVAKDTVEEDLCKLLQRKQAVLSNVLDGGPVKGDLDIYDQLTKTLQNKGVGRAAGSKKADP